jgi:hypothetical protein
MWTELDPILLEAVYSYWQYNGMSRVPASEVSSRLRGILQTRIFYSFVIIRILKRGM